MIGLGGARVLPLFTDFVFVVLALYFIVLYGRTFVFNLQHHPSFLFYETLFLAYQLTALALLVVRRNMLAFSSKISDYLCTIIALASPMFFQLVIGGNGSFVGELFVLVGAILTVGAVLSLNKSFGIAPENRGIKTNGVYRLVRHPMYLGYLLTEVGFVLGNFSPLNLLILAVASSFLVLRLQAEERLLREDPAYQAYTKKTHWKLVPILF